MTTDLLTFPEIVPPPEVPAVVQSSAVAAPEPKTLTVAEFVRAQFAGHEPTLTMLVAKHKADKVLIGPKTTETTKSLTAAKAIRAELREQGRFPVQRALDALKKELNGAKGIAEGEAARLIAITEPVEKLYDDAIKAEEARIEAERQAELDRQRVRREGFQQAIRGILEYQRHAAGLPAERIARGLEKLSLMTFPADHWQEFTDEAVQAHAETLEALRKMHADAVMREALEAENARLRAEAEARAAQERKAAEELAAARAESERLEALAEANRKRVAEEEAKRIEKASQMVGSIVVDQVLTEEAPRKTAAEMLKEAMAAGIITVESGQEPASVQAPEAHDMPAIKLGDINAAIGRGFTMTSEFAEQVLGVPGERVKASYCYTAAGRRALLQALVARIQKVM